MVPVDVAWRQHAGCTVATVRDTERLADSKSALNEVQAVPAATPDSVEFAPFHAADIQASLCHEPLYQVPELVVDDRSDDACSQTEAAAKGSGNVVFPSAFGHPEVSGASYAVSFRVEAKHHLAERNDVQGALGEVS